MGSKGFVAGAKLAVCLQCVLAWELKTPWLTGWRGPVHSDVKNSLRICDGVCTPWPHTPAWNRRRQRRLSSPVLHGSPDGTGDARGGRWVVVQEQQMTENEDSETKVLLSRQRSTGNEKAVGMVASLKANLNSDR
ncbi:hypothetical protein CBR_g32288 [Chara braunii]|uniref:Uncharacterized protein n=1 Tax=Chara braunii TaxID=69332 RepID=A0A388JNE4_CHABU|nr:hypothetical protein CBR_g32288 [Chara braunii]|eukprot:GBG59273.1 hypothetical protein CBR_g32288 [Chara braunii]